MKLVVVAGGGGYIGTNLVEFLLAAGYRVRALDRFFFGRERLKGFAGEENLTLVKQDSRDVGPADLEGADAVVDLAGISNDPACDLHPSITEEVNQGGARKLAQAAREAGIRRYVYGSSCSVYGFGSDDFQDEDSEPRPVSLYARSKVAAEKELLGMAGADFGVTLLRNATVYGLSRRMRFDLVINLMTLHAYKNRRIFVLGGGKQWRPLVHVRDVTRAIHLVLEAPLEKVAGQIFNVGSTEQNYQTFSIAQMVRDVVPHTEVVTVPDDPDKRTYRVDFSRIAKVLGFTVEKSPYEGIVEIKQALERGLVQDDVSTRTVDFYRYLLDAEKLLREVTMNGKVF